MDSGELQSIHVKLMVVDTYTERTHIRSMDLQSTDTVPPEAMKGVVDVMVKELVAEVKSVRTAPRVHKSQLRMEAVDA